MECGKLTAKLRDAVPVCLMVDGKEVIMTVNVGDKVIISKYAGTEVKCDGVEYSIVRQGDILAIVE